MTIYEIVMTIIYILIGGISLYIKTKSDLSDLAIEKIGEVEEIYRDSTKAGGIKFQWVVDKLYEHLPPPLKLFFSKKVIETIVQKIFDSIEAYAVVQLDKLEDKIANI